MIKNASKDIYKDYKTEIIEHKRPILNYIFTVFILFLIQNKEKKYKRQFSIQHSSTVTISLLIFKILKKKKPIECVFYTLPEIIM